MMSKEERDAAVDAAMRHSHKRGVIVELVKSMPNASSEEVSREIRDRMAKYDHDQLVAKRKHLRAVKDTD